MNLNPSQMQHVCATAFFVMQADTMHTDKYIHEPALVVSAKGMYFYDDRDAELAKWV